MSFSLNFVYVSWFQLAEKIGNLCCIQGNSYFVNSIF